MHSARASKQHILESVAINLSHFQYFMEQIRYS